jgi:hypothetical protein
MRQIKSRKMGWTGLVARVREERKVYKAWWEIPKERDYSRDQGVDGRMELEWILGRLVGCGDGVDSPNSG